MKAFLSGCAMMVILAGVVLQTSPEVLGQRRQALKLQGVTLGLQRQLAKEEQRRLWRQKYLTDMKRLIERLQKAYRQVELDR